MNRIIFFSSAVLAGFATLYGARITQTPHGLGIVTEHLGRRDEVQPSLMQKERSGPWWSRQKAIDDGCVGMGQCVRRMLKLQFSLPTQLRELVMQTLPLRFSLVAAAGPLATFTPEHRVGLVVVEVGSLLLQPNQSPHVMSRASDVVSARTRGLEPIGGFHIEKLLISPLGNFGYISADCFDKVFDVSRSAENSFDKVISVSGDGEMVLEHWSSPVDFYMLRHFQSGLRGRLNAAESATAEHQEGLFSPKGDKVAVIAYTGLEGALAKMWIWNTKTHRLLHQGAVQLGRPRPKYKKYPTFAFDGERIALCDGTLRRGYLFVARDCSAGSDAFLEGCDLVRDEMFESCEDVSLQPGVILQVHNTYGNATRVVSIQRIDGEGRPLTAHITGVSDDYLWEQWRGRFSPDGRKVALWQEIGGFDSRIPVMIKLQIGATHLWAFADEQIPPEARLPWAHNRIAPVSTLAFTSDSAWLIAGDEEDRVLRFFDMESREMVVFNTSFEVTAIAVVGEHGSWVE
mmetsp:Transcript_119949/g.344746  ORF Transcript_119949/g.344746 Transcript_119949/m.344746 type:complete len:515 (-) Transcript_119949:169-1713(-)|eukprot:CAMPEP_0170245404 /NCGR_PEP_ID=MMETSP0116_2-20130129/22487_1 /TAXON_ID=400756 /ORGANISM="Durinskia baltica, Strain CSIRO CS-38" /LENGTH=514 /DNA_ID=CAMNT_0010496277 /DNA_START=67 /DNA_END=1611 /DNA_ORIENTATION=-